MIPRLGTVLVNRGLITQEALEAALVVRRNEDALLGEILLRQGAITEEGLSGALAEQHGVEYRTVDWETVDSQLIHLVPESLIRARLVLPIAVEDQKLILAMVTPDDLDTISEVELLTGYCVEPVGVSSGQMLFALEQYFDENVTAQQTLIDMRVDEIRSGNTDTTDDHPIQDYDPNDAPVVRLVNSVISGGVRIRASDIHMEPQANEVRVRYRVDGELQEFMTIPRRIISAVVSRIKVMADMDITEYRNPQDGHISLSEEGRLLDLRVSVIPTVCGEKVAIRVLERGTSQFNFKRLGFPEYEFHRIQRMISRPHGMILVTGPTGSGKSTTLYTVLAELNQPNRNIVTVEDPVEYQLEGINQIQVDAEFGLGFASSLKYLLRQDPDVVMVGEIRDRETAEIAVQAAQTGHLLLSTMHTNDAVGIVTRFADLGVDSFLIADALVGVAAQRLVRRNCEKCKEEYEPTPAALRAVVPDKCQDNGYKFFRGTGCNKCSGSGFHGRLPIFETLVITLRLKEAIERNTSTSEIRAIAEEEGMITLAAAGFDRVRAGETTVEEVRQKIIG
ncbi:MAG: Flp pilus assembly complex ATPase component TadA [Phycisphaerales bacterium]|nr:MAG: Flp pilus assembly complex ATPase component TadA [Phycisphaerales bacterium]